ncbi:MAG: hypothetical protein U9R25_04570 [Chloroflexota bacterium]|nr:hypothetical protein [Chloroflexota bacterium]
MFAGAVKQERKRSGEKRRRLSYLAVVSVLLALALAAGACAQPVVVPGEPGPIEVVESVKEMPVAEVPLVAEPPAGDSGNDPTVTPTPCRTSCSEEFACSGDGQNVPLRCMTVSEPNEEGHSYPVILNVPLQSVAVEVQRLSLESGIIETACPDPPYSWVVVIFDVVPTDDGGEPLTTFDPPITLQVVVGAEDWKDAEEAGLEAPEMAYCDPYGNQEWIVFDPEKYRYQAEGNSEIGGLLSAQITSWEDPAIASGP